MIYLTEFFFYREDQSSETKVVNAGVRRVSLLGPTLFLSYMNYLPNYTFPSLAYIYDTTVYVYVSKTLHDQSLAADLSSDQVLTVQWRKTGWSHSMTLKLNY